MRVSGYSSRRTAARVNAEKSAVARPWDRKFLGYSSRRSANAAEDGAASGDPAEGKVRERMRTGRGRYLGHPIEEH